MFDAEQLKLLSDIVTAIIWVFLIIGIGSLCRVTGIVTENSEKCIMRLVLLVLYPSFILSKIPGNESLQQISNVAWALGCGAVLTLLGLGVAYGVGRLLGIRDPKEHGTFCLATAIQNYGFIPIPLILALYPEVASETLGVLFVHNLGLELVLWTVGIIVLSGSANGAWRRLINGPSVAIVIGLLLNFTGAFKLIPAPVATTFEQLGNCAIPVSLLLVGVALAGVLMKEKFELNWRVACGALLTRFAIMPAVFLGAAFLIGSSFSELSLILIVEASMPAAVFPIVIAKHFDGRPSIAVQVFLVTSAVSLILTPLILAFGITLCGGE